VSTGAVKSGGVGAGGCACRAKRIGRYQPDWAPQQIAGWLKDEYPKNPELWVSHETIYRSLFVQARGALKKAAIDHYRLRYAVLESPDRAAAT
jgi:IS30 family transposase